MTVTLQFQSSGTVPGNGRPVVMRGPSLSIGRGPENDLVLPDPDRQISKCHCVIENHNGNVVAVDVSTNGTFLNYGKIPLGRTPTPLNHGDVLSLGPYEIIVEMAGDAAQEMLLAPAMDDPVSHGNASAAPDPLTLLDDAGGDFLDDLLGDGPKGPGQWSGGPDDFDGLLPPLGDDEADFLAPPAPRDEGPAPSDHSAATSDAFSPRAPVESVIPDDWEDDLLAPAPSAGSADPFADLAPAPAAPQSSPRPAPPVPDPHQAIPANEPQVGPAYVAAPLVPAPDQDDRPAEAAVVPASAAPGAPVPQDSAAARAFLHALGASDVAIPDAELVPAMTRLGATLKTMITGMREILMTRTSIKSEFRIDQTMISVGGNNPLKFSVSPEQAIEAMVKPSSRGYLGAEQAAEQALDDIKAHEIAMVTGMEAALKGVLAKLEPGALTGRIEARSGLSGLLKGKKAQYWETYEKIYSEVADQAENDFHELFSREFAQAYKEQLAKLKRRT